MEIIRQTRITTANIPRGCALNEAEKSPLNNQAIECPKPQPGQNPSPVAFKGQILACPSTGDIAAISVRPNIQTMASNLALKNCQPFLKMRFILFLVAKQMYNRAAKNSNNKAMNRSITAVNDNNQYVNGNKHTIR